ncbi:MAG: cupin-like domain-containing protein [Thermosynechococcaceae cyanobacterium]
MNNNNVVYNNFLFMQQDVEREFSASLSVRIRNEFPKIDRVHDIKVDEFRELFVKQGKPVILSGLTEDWNNKNLFNLDYFTEKCGDAHVLINPNDTKLTEQSDIRTIINRIKQSDLENPVYLQEWWFQEDYEAFLDDIGYIEHFDDDWGKKVLGFVNHTLWIGSRGAKTPIHADTAHFNLSSIQLFGKKEWFLFARDACLHMNKNGRPDYDRFLIDPTTQAMSGTLEQGEILFMPYRWWHRTEILEHSASLNSMYITEDIIQPYVRALFSMPLLMALRHDDLKERSPIRYNVTLDRIKKFSHLIKFDSEYAMHTINNG